MNQLLPPCLMFHAASAIAVGKLRRITLSRPEIFEVQSTHLHTPHLVVHDNLTLRPTWMPS